MSDPNKDWLDQELEHLRDLEAPATLLPNVMKKVRQRAKRLWWGRLVESQAGLLRSLVVGVSLLMLVLLLVVNPTELFSRLPGASALFNLIPLLLDAAKATLLEAKVFNFSLLGLFAPAIILSYILLVAIASTIQHLAKIRK
jgi:hypothetical protein